MSEPADPFPIREPDHLIRIHLRFELEALGFSVSEAGEVLEIDTTPREDAEGEQD